MIINSTSAPSLLAQMQTDLQACPDLTDAILRSGGGEVGFRGLITLAIDRWLSSSMIPSKCATEYKRMDYVIFDPKSGNSSGLAVSDLIEVKFNYASQTTEIGRRTGYYPLSTNPTPKVLRQVDDYALAFGNPVHPVGKHVLYILADYCSTLPVLSKNEQYGAWRYIPSVPASGRLTASAKMVRHNLATTGAHFSPATSTASCQFSVAHWEIHTELFGC